MRHTCVLCGHIFEGSSVLEGLACPKCGTPVSSILASYLEKRDQEIAQQPGLTRYALVTYAVMLICTVVWIGMVLDGVDALSPLVGQVLPWGASYAPLILENGEWYRLGTGLFLPAGLIDWIVSLACFWFLGRPLETLVGNWSFAILIVVSGLCGELASLSWEPERAVVGTCGMVIGMLGAVVAMSFVIPRDQRVDMMAMQKAAIAAAIAMLHWPLLYGPDSVNYVQYLGSFVSGLAAGCILIHPPTEAGKQSRLWRGLLLASLGALAVLLGVQVLRNRPATFEAAVLHLDRVEDVTRARYRQASADFRNDPTRAAEFADVLETELLPAWRAARERLENVAPVTPADQERHRLYLDYVVLQQEAWELLAQGLRSWDTLKISAAAKKLQQALAKAKLIRQSP